MTPKEFVKEYLPYALASEKQTGISAVFTLAQAALESGWGESAPHYNFFGVKARKDTPMSKKQTIITTEYLKKKGVKFPAVLSETPIGNGVYKYRVMDWFMAYENATEAFDDHGDFFYRNKRYVEALKHKGDPYKFAEMIAAAGYATSPTYADKLKKVIRMIEKEMP